MTDTEKLHAALAELERVKQENDKLIAEQVVFAVTKGLGSIAAADARTEEASRLGLLWKDRAEKAERERDELRLVVDRFPGEKTPRFCGREARCSDPTCDIHNGEAGPWVRAERAEAEVERVKAEMHQMSEDWAIAEAEAGEDEAAFGKIRTELTERLGMAARDLEHWKAETAGWKDRAEKSESFEKDAIAAAEQATARAEKAEREVAGVKALVDQLNAKLDVQNLARCVKCETTVPTDEGLRARVAEAEKERDEARASVETMEWARSERFAEIAELQAQLAAMRDLLREWRTTPFFEDPREWKAWVADFGTRVDAALSPDAGNLTENKLAPEEQTSGATPVLADDEVRLPCSSFICPECDLRMVTAEPPFQYVPVERLKPVREALVLIDRYARELPAHVWQRTSAALALLDELGVKP